MMSIQTNNRLNVLLKGHILSCMSLPMVQYVYEGELWIDYDYCTKYETELTQLLSNSKKKNEEQLIHPWCQFSYAMRF